MDLLRPEPTARLAALRSLPEGAPGLYALRDVLLLDADANVRALAAEIAGNVGPDGLELAAAWLVEALSDTSPRVRDASIRALVRSKRREASPAIARLCLEEPAWWVRRAAVIALNALSPELAVPTFCAALDDPFWRVRYPAILALAAIGDRRPAIRAEILRDPEGVSEAGVSARVFLRSRWDPAARPELDPARPELTARADDGLWNADPAVMTARLEGDRKGSLDPLRVVELLADPHEPLRKAAAAIVRARGDDRAIIASTLFLDQIRVPYANEAAAALLDSLKAKAEPAARHVITHGKAHAVAWAARFVAEHGSGVLIEPLLARWRDRDPRVRAAVTSALASLGEDVRTALDDADAGVRAAAIRALVGLQSGSDDGSDALAGVAAAAQAPEARRALVEHAAMARDVRRLRAATSDADAFVRARAVAARRSQGDLSLAERDQLLRDADPWVRAAAFDLETAPHLVQADASPWVRRAALDVLVAHRAAVPIELREAVMDAISTGLDVWSKIRAAALVSADEGPRSLAALLRLFRDEDAGVRGAAEDTLLAYNDLSSALRVVVASADTGASERLAAWTLLLRAADDSASNLRRAALLDPSTPAAIRDLLVAIGPLFGDDPSAAPRVSLSLPSTAPQTSLAAPLPEGALSKLAISGVFELDRGDYERALDAGVNTFFWEPGYRTLQPFLRDPRVRRAACVVTGSYEGSPKSIRKDVDRALKSLRREALDVFLLFWVRSPERLAPEVLAALADLKREGKVLRVGFSTHHRDLAREAVLRGGVDVVMTRHSAAHPGAERDLVPTALEKGVGVITFSALSYGRLLRPALPVASGDTRRAPSFTAADCYRYSMKQPASITCVAAPRSAAELEHDVEALRAPSLPADVERDLLAHGERVRSASRSFNDLVRMPRSGALFPSSAPPELAYELDLDLEPPADPAPFLAQKAAVGGSR